VLAAADDEPTGCWFGIPFWFTGKF